MFLSDLIYLSYTNKLKRKCFIKIITKVTLYAIWKDVTPPVIGTLTFSPTESTQGDVTLTGKATDLGSGISYYQFSTNENLTSSSFGWISITNTTKEITQTYTVVNNGTYYFYAKDAAGNINKKAVVISNIRYVAQIGNIKYRTLSEAIEAVKTDETILMIGDTTENNTVPEGKKFTLDLGEQTITGGILNNGEVIMKGEGTITRDTEIIIENNGFLTIEGGSYIKTGKSGRVIKNYGQITINSGIFKKLTNGWAVENLGTFYFNGGKIILDYAGDGTALYNTSGTVEMTGGEISSKTYGVCIDGGSFKATGGVIQKDSAGGYGCAFLVRNTGSAYLYNTLVTTVSQNDGRLVNETEKYKNLIYIYTENNQEYIEGIESGKVFRVQIRNSGDIFIRYCNSGYTTGNLAIWSTKDGQDDLEWTTPHHIQEDDLHFNFSKSNHKNESGEYNLHLYTNGTSTFVEGIIIDIP